MCAIESLVVCLAQRMSPPQQAWRIGDTATDDMCPSSPSQEEATLPEYNGIGALPVAIMFV